jgi:phosphoglycolate phosphatase-like HAD superfamily hydrolase
MFKLLIFDFDDTIIKSQKIKINSFYDILTKYNVNKELITNILCKNPDLNRYDTISLMIKNSNLDYNSIINEYNEKVKIKLLNTNYLPYSKEILEMCFKKNIPIYINSNTPINILEDLLENLKIKYLFKKVYGYPMNKSESVAEIIKLNNISNKEILLIGDGNSDYKAAYDNNINFFLANDNTMYNLFEILNHKYDK